MSPLERKRPTPENLSGLKWEPIAREELFTQPRLAEAGAFQWNPNLILYGKKLEINISALERLSRQMGLTSPVVINPISIPPDQNDYFPDSNSSTGETTLSLRIEESEPVDGGFIDYDDETDKIYMNINFSGLADQAESRLPGGRNDSQFFPRYAGLVNSTTKDLLKWMPFASLGLKSEKPTPKQKIIPHEATAMILASIPGVIYLTDSLIKTLNENPDLADPLTQLALLISIDATSYFAINLFAMWSSKVHPNTTPTIAEYGNYLRDGIREKQWGRIFFPEQFIKEIIVPFRHSFFPGGDLIRSKSKAVSSGQ